MIKPILFIALAFAVLATITSAGAEPPTTYRNSLGQVQGYAQQRGNATRLAPPSAIATGRPSTTRRASKSAQRGAKLGLSRSALSLALRPVRVKAWHYAGP
jgi:hypothetical protein